MPYLSLRNHGGFCRWISQNLSNPFQNIAQPFPDRDRGEKQAKKRGDEPCNGLSLCSLPGLTQPGSSAAEGVIPGHVLSLSVPSQRLFPSPQALHRL